MLDKDISPGDYDSCPECDDLVVITGDKIDGSAYCMNDECEYERHWEHLPV